MQISARIVAQLRGFSTYAIEFLDEDDTAKNLGNFVPDKGVAQISSLKKASSIANCYWPLVLTRHKTALTESRC